MNTPETINIEKYAEALNNLIGVDSAYVQGDKDVDAIVEVIVAAKKLENRVKELTDKLNHSETSYNELYELTTEEIKDLYAERDRLTEENERLRAQNETLEIIEKDLRFRNKELQKCNEGLAKNIEELEIEGDKVREAYAYYEETTGLKQVKADTVHKMQTMIKEECLKGGIWPAFVARVVENVGKKLLED